MDIVVRGDNREAAEYYLDIILRAGAERIAEHAINVLWLIQKEPFLNLTGDYFHWPYAEEKSDFSLADELIWVMHEAGHEVFEDNYRQALQPYCRRLLEAVQDGEEDLLIVAVTDNSKAAMTHLERLELVEREIETDVLRLAASFDRQVLNEEFLARGFQN